MICFLLSFQNSGFANTDERENASELESKADTYLKPYLERGDFSGAILIAKGDTVLLDKAYGMASYELNVPNTTATKFPVASVTKTFTAAAIAVLQEKGLLEISDTLGAHIPDFTYGDKITIRHLLRHESGLSNPDYVRNARPVSLKELARQIGAKPLLFEPGTNGRYSNGGFNLLAYVVEQVAGMSYADFLQKNIFEPLALQGTDEQSDAIVHDLALPYLPGPPPTGLAKAPWRYDGLSTGSGSLYSTTSDLYRWLKAVHHNQLFDITALEYPYGWGRLDKYGHKGLEQTGLSTGYTSYIAAYFDDDLYVVVLTNAESIKWNKWGRDLAAIALEKEYEEEDVPMGIAISGKELAKCVGKYQREEQILTIVNNDDHLWVYTDQWPIGKYLLPVSESKFALRADFGWIVFDTLQNNVYQNLTWHFNDDARSQYQRLD